MTTRSRKISGSDGRQRTVTFAFVVNAGKANVFLRPVSHSPPTRHTRTHSRRGAHLVASAATYTRAISCTRVLFLFPPSSGLRNRLASVMPIFALATREESVLQAGRRLREIAAFCSLVLLRRRVFAEFWAVLIFGWL